MMSELKKIIDKIDSFEKLGDNWDGYGGIAVLSGVAVNARNFLAALDQRLVKQISDIFPNPNGTISMEWENEKNEKLCLEIGKNNYSFYFRENSYFLKSVILPLDNPIMPLFFNGQNVAEDIKTVSFYIEKIVGEKI